MPSPLLTLQSQYLTKGLAESAQISEPDEFQDYLIKPDGKEGATRSKMA